MKTISLLVSPLAKSAYFTEYLDVARAELLWLLGDTPVVFRRIAAMDFIELEVAEAQLPQLARLSFIGGIFERQGEHTTDGLLPLSIDTGFDLHEDFVFGSKYRGKTNELLTQMLINIGLQSVQYESVSDVKLLDPMCGRATTLLWALRYGMKARGIEQDTRALADIRQNIKKWCKVHRQKHQFEEGFNGKANKNDLGKFVKFSTLERDMRVVAGDSSNASVLLKGEKFQLIVSDLPYGIQHLSSDRARNPLAVLQTCAPVWINCLRPGGAMVLAFNRYQPKRDELTAAFTDCGMQLLDFSAPHRMSESIVRDIVVLQKP